MSTGKAALIAWTADIMASRNITTGLAWDPTFGWRGGLMLDSGKTLMLPARQLRKLADAFERKGARKVAPELGPIIDDMYEMAAEVKRKNAAREVPPGAAGVMPIAGRA